MASLKGALGKTSFPLAPPDTGHCQSVYLVSEVTYVLPSVEMDILIFASPFQRTVLRAPGCSLSWTAHTKSPSFAHKSASESANTSETKSGLRLCESLCPTRNNGAGMETMLLTSHLGYKTVIP